MLPGGDRPSSGSRPAVEFKGLSHPALRVLVNDGASPAIAAALAALDPGDPAGFEWQPAILDLAQFRGDSPPDLASLCKGLRAMKLHPVAVAGAPDALREPAEALQLGWLSAIREPRRQADAEPAATSTAAAAVSQALTVDRPVRSGQQVYARDADLIVIGAVSPGAEVIADGNVHVYGCLQGRAIAGARGRRDVGIFALDFQAELVAVSGIYRTFEDGVPAGNRGRPVRVELDPVADRLTVRPL